MARENLKFSNKRALIFFYFLFNYKSLPTNLKICYKQSFIQALLLTSVFHERLSFMAVCHNLKFVNMMTLAAGGGGVIWGAVSPPPPEGSRAMSMKALAISSIPDFQIVSPCIIW